MAGTRQAYKSKIELAFNYRGIRENISSDRLTYIMNEYDYEKQVLPIIYVCFSASTELYTKIMKYKKEASFYLCIKKANANSKFPVYKTILSGNFTYIPSNANPNYTEELDVGDGGNAYKRITVGLISMELTNSLRTSFNDIYNNINTNTLLGIALNGTDCIVERPTKTKSFSTLIVPPIASRYQMIKFIFEEEPFYNTYFRYFMDFDKSYLLSNLGGPVDGGDGELSNIIFDIRSVTEEEAYYDGIEVKNNAYYVYISPPNSNITLNESTEKVANQIVGFDEDGTYISNLEINNSKGSEKKQMFMRTDNVELYKNELETNTIIIEVTKQHIDGTLFTPNKCINVKNYGDYAQYNGRYIMVYKRDIYRAVAGEFLMSTCIGLKKVANIDSVVAASAKNAINKISSAIKTSTANIKNTSRSVSKAIGELLDD